MNTLLAAVAALALAGPALAQNAGNGSHGFVVYTTVGGEPYPLAGALAVDEHTVVTTPWGAGAAEGIGQEIGTDWYVLGADCVQHPVVGAVGIDPLATFVLLEVEGQLTPAPHGTVRAGENVTYVSMLPIADCGFMAAFANDRLVLSVAEWAGFGNLATVDWTVSSWLSGEHVATPDGVGGLVIDRPDTETAFVVGWDRIDALERTEPLDAAETAEAFAQTRLTVRLTALDAATERGDGNLTRAARLATEAIEQDDRCWRAWYELGVVRDLSGDPAGASEALRRAIEIEPKFAESRFSLALIALNNAGDEADLRETVRLFDEAIEANPRLASAHGMRAVALYKLGNPDEAVTSARLATQCEPHSGEHHSNLQYFLNEQGRELEAAEVGLDAARQFARTEDDWLGAATAFARLDQRDRASDILIEAHEALPGSARCAYYAGLVLMERGEIEPARAAFERAIELDPEYAEPARERLREMDQSGD